MNLLSIIQHIDFRSLEGDGINECQRLFHGRGHSYEGLEHLSVDWLAPVILITLYKEELEDDLTPLAEALLEQISECSSIQVQYRCRKGAPMMVLIGDEVTETIVSENGLKYHIQLGKSQNTGLFLDMVNGRSWVRHHAENKRVLNLFSYTCAFSVAALAGGASYVVNFDNNKSVLKKGRENHRINDVDVRSANFEQMNILKSFGRLKKHGPYDLLICDPPSFQKGSVDIRTDYRKILKRLPEFMQPDSQLMLCLNSPDLSEDFLLDMVAEECPEYIFVQSIPTPDVFKEAMTGKGLKVLIFEMKG